MTSNSMANVLRNTFFQNTRDQKTKKKSGNHWESQSLDHGPGSRTVHETYVVCLLLFLQL